MNILIPIILVITGIILIVLLVALLAKKGYDIKREIIINAPVQKAFDYLKYLKNWDNFSERVQADPEKKEAYKGTDGTEGFMIAWSGNKKVGEGEKEIISIVEGKKIETEIRFIKPFAVTGHTAMETETISGTQTKVTFHNSSTLPYPMNFLLLFVENGIAKDMERSLLCLKNILEK
jgi:hypothetical protein